MQSLVSIFKSALNFVFPVAVSSQPGKLYSCLWIPSGTDMFLIVETEMLNVKFGCVIRLGFGLAPSVGVGAGKQMRKLLSDVIGDENGNETRAKHC